MTILFDKRIFIFDFLEYISLHYSMNNFPMKTRFVLILSLILISQTVLAQNADNEEPVIELPPLFLRFSPAFQIYILKLNEPKRSEYHSVAAFEKAFQKHQSELKELKKEEKTYSDSLNNFLENEFMPWLSRFNEWSQAHKVWRSNNNDWRNTTVYRGLIPYFYSSNKDWSKASQVRNSTNHYNTLSVSYSGIQDSLSSIAADHICERAGIILAEFDEHEIEYIINSTILDDKLAMLLFQEHIDKEGKTLSNSLESFTKKVLKLIRFFEQMSPDLLKVAPEIRHYNNSETFDRRIASKLIQKSNNCKVIGYILLRGLKDK